MHIDSLALKHTLLSSILGNGPDRGQSPVEWEIFRPSVRPVPPELVKECLSLDIDESVNDLTHTRTHTHTNTHICTQTYLAEFLKSVFRRTLMSLMSPLTTWHTRTHTHLHKHAHALSQTYLAELLFDDGSELVKECLPEDIDESVDYLAQISAAQKILEIDENRSESNVQTKVVHLKMEEMGLDQIIGITLEL